MKRLAWMLCLLTGCQTVVVRTERPRPDVRGSIFADHEVETDKTRVGFKLEFKL